MQVVDVLTTTAELKGAHMEPLMQNQGSCLPPPPTNKQTSKPTNRHLRARKMVAAMIIITTITNEREY